MCPGPARLPSMARSRWWRSCTGQQALVHARSSFSLFSIIADDAEAMVGCRKQPEQCGVVAQSCRATISFRMLPLFRQDSFSSSSSTCNFAAERPPVHVRASLAQPRRMRASRMGVQSSALRADARAGQRALSTVETGASRSFDWFSNLPRALFFP